MIIRLGPLPREGAVHWTADTISLLDALGDSPLLPFALPREQRAAMRALLEGMQRRARSAELFEWELEATLEDLKPILTYWLNIGRLSDQAVAGAGARWSTPEGEEFHAAILNAVLEQIAEEDPSYADRLRRAWRHPVGRPEDSGDV